MTAMPASISYEDVLPVAVPAVARRRRFYPQNGTTFNALGSQEIRIEVSSSNALLDAAHSYLEFFVFNNGTGTTFAPDLGGGHVFFDEVWVEQQGRVLAREQAHNRLHAGILSAAQVNDDGQFGESISQMQRGCNQGIGGAVAQMTPAPGALAGDVYVNRVHNNVGMLPNNTGVRIAMAMPTGLFTQNKLLPLPLVAQNAPLTLCFRLAEPQLVGVWGAAPGAAGLEIRRMNYVAQMVEVGGDVLQQFRTMQDMSGGQLTISTTDIEHSQGPLANNLQGEQIIRVPIRKRSVKSLLFQINSEDVTNLAAPNNIRNIYNLSFGGNASMTSYQLKVGAVVYPPTPVGCWGDPARAAVAGVSDPGNERGECAMELAKALGTLGFTNPTGRLSGITYGVNNQTVLGVAAGPLADGDNGDGAAFVCTQSSEKTSVCPFGLDLDSFQQTAIEAGVDSETLALETNLILQLGGAGSGAEDKNVHTYLVFDRHYYFNADGSITTSE